MDQQEVKRVEERTPNQRISQQEFDIPQANPPHRRIDVPAMKDKNEGEGERVAEKHSDVQKVRKHHQITHPISLISGAVLWSKNLSETVQSSSLGCYGLTQRRESVGFSGLHRVPIVPAVLDRRRPKLQLPGQ